MEESILNSIKKMLGISEEYEAFDLDIMFCINSALSNLNQLGVGPDEGFGINGKSDSWTDFLGNSKKFESAKNYVYLKVRMQFDPPTNSSIASSFENQIKELEFRLAVKAEQGEKNV